MLLKKLNNFLFKPKELDKKIKILNSGYGHHLSKQLKSAINAKNEPLPWFTYSSIEFLEQLDFTETDVFEWGSGNSSKYFANRCHHITSIEHNLDWYNTQKVNLRKNQQLIHAADNVYANAINEFNKKFDIIIIDGILRGDCLTNALNFINEDGLFIYDNSDRDPQNCLILRNAGYTQIDFSGFGPINDYTWTTSIFFKQFKFKPLSVQPVIPIGGGY